MLKLMILDQTTMSLTQGKTKKNGHPERSRRTEIKSYKVAVAV